MKVEKLSFIIICLVGLTLFQCGGKVTVPADLIGVWETTTPSYSDRPFEITAKELSFGIGEGNFNTYPITKVKIEKDPKEQAPLYIICYKNETKQEYKFSFYYDPTNQGTIRFKNHREMVWTKKALSSASK